MLSDVEFRGKTGDEEEKKLNFINFVCRKKYLVVALHLGMAELTVGSEGEVTLSLATISFRDNIRGSWFVGINQPANINRKSASKLGFHQKVLALKLQSDLH